MEGRLSLDVPAKRPVRHAIEVRHESFRTPELGALLRAHDVALVVADTAGTFPYLEDVTAGFVYVRLHGPDPHHLYAGSYPEADLGWWAERLREWREQGRDVYAYFNNDGHGYAVRDAWRLRALVRDG